MKIRLVTITIASFIDFAFYIKHPTIFEVMHFWIMGFILGMALLGILDLNEGRESV